MYCARGEAAPMLFRQLVVCASLCVALLFAVSASAAQLSWLKLSPAASPSARRDCAHAYDSANNAVWLYGGRTSGANNPSVVLDETWYYDLNSSTWTQLQPSNNPGKRFSMPGGFHNGQFCFATGDSGGAVVFNDYWCFTVSTSCTGTRLCGDWSKVSLDGDTPKKRYGTGGGFKSDGTFTVFGGFGSARYADSFKIKDNKWDEIDVGRKHPSPRCLVGSAVTGSEALVVAGGCGSGGWGPCPAHDSWVLAGDDWHVANPCPPAGNFMSVARWGTGAIVWGGTGYVKKDETGIYALEQDGDGFSFKARKVAGTVPPAMAGSSLVWIGSNTWLLFGGQSKDGVQSQTWKLSGNPNDSEEGTCHGNPIDLRFVHGGLMAAGWLFTLPIGVLVAHFGRKWDPLWFQIHRALQVTGVVCVLIGFIIIVAFVSDNGGGHFKKGQGAHSILGIVIVAAAVFQPISAVLRPHKVKGEAPSRKRVIWEYVHKGTGWIATVLGLINCLLGLALVGYFARKAFIAAVVFVALYAATDAILSIIKMRTDKLANNNEKELQPVQGS